MSASAINGAQHHQGTLAQNLCQQVKPGTVKRTHRRAWHTSQLSHSPSILCPYQSHTNSQVNASSQSVQCATTNHQYSVQEDAKSDLPSRTYSSSQHLVNSQQTTTWQDASFVSVELDDHLQGYAPRFSTSTLDVPRHEHADVSSSHSIDTPGWILTPIACSSADETTGVSGADAAQLQIQSDCDQHESQFTLVKSASHIMGIIKHRKTLADLEQTLQRYHDQLNMLHASAATSHTAQLISQSISCQQIPARLLSQLAHLQCKHLHEFGPRQVANSLWALAKILPEVSNLPVQSGTQSARNVSTFHEAHVQQRLLQAVHSLVSMLPACLPGMQKQELANVVHALGSLRPYVQVSTSCLSQVQRSCEGVWDQFNTVEINSILYGVARMTDGGAVDALLSEQMQELAKHQSQDDVMSGNEPLQEAVTCSVEILGWCCQLLHVHSRHIHNMSVPQLSSSIWAVSQLKELAQSTHMTQMSLAHSQVADLGSHVNSHAVQLLTAIQDYMPSVGPVELATVLTSLPRLSSYHSELQQHQQQGHADVLDQLLQRAQQLAAQGLVTPRVCAATLDAVALMEGPAASCQQTLIALTAVVERSCNLYEGSEARSMSQRQLQASVQDVAVSLHALQRLGLPPHPNTARIMLGHCQALLEAENTQLHDSTQHAIQLLHACAKLRLMPSSGFLAAFQKASYAHRRSIQPRFMACMLWSLASLGVRPGRKWMSDMLSLTWSKSVDYKLDELCQIVASLGRMQYQSSGDLSDQLLLELQQRCTDKTPAHQLQAVLSALAHSPRVAPTTLQWATEVLFSELLLPHLHSMSTRDVVSMLWSAARLSRQLNARNGQVFDQQQHWTPQHVSQQQHATMHVAQHADSQDKATHTPAYTEHHEYPLVASITRPEEGAQVPEPEIQEEMPHADQLVRPNLPSSIPSNQGGQAAEWRLLRLQRRHIWRSRQQVAMLLDHVAHLASGSTVEPQAHQLDNMHQLYQQVHDSRHAGHKHAAQATFSAQQLAVVLYTLPLLNIRPSKVMLQSMLFSKPDLLISFSNHELCMVLFALACMKQAPPGAWLQECLKQVMLRAPGLNTGMVSGVLRALSILSITPGPAWLSTFIQMVAPALALMPERQLIKAHAAAVDLEPQLAPTWGHNFRLLLGRDDHDYAYDYHAMSSQSSGHGQGQAQKSGSSLDEQDWLDTRKGQHGMVWEEDANASYNIMPRLPGRVVLRRPAARVMTRSQ